MVDLDDVGVRSVEVDDHVGVRVVEFAAEHAAPVRAWSDNHCREVAAQDVVPADRNRCGRCHGDIVVHAGPNWPRL